MKAFTALLFACLSVSSQAAPRIDIVAQFGNERVSGARVCFSRRAIPNRVRVINLLVSGPETRCLPADDVLNVPAGVWHAYVVADDPFLVSGHPIVLERSHPSSDEEDVKRVIVEMLPAAVLDVGAPAKNVRSDESLAVYVTNRNSDVSPAALVPLPPGATELPVPAGMPVRPLILRGHEVVSVGEEVTISVGQRMEAQFPASSGTAIVIPFLLPQADEGLKRPWIRTVHRRSGAEIARYKPLKADYRGLLFVTDVERGAVNVLVEGDEVSAPPLAVDVRPIDNGRVLMAEDLVMPVTRSRTTVQWSLDDQFRKDVRSPICTPGADDATKPRKVRPAQLHLYSCAEDQAVSRPIQLRECTLVRQAVLPDLERGVVRWSSPLAMNEAVLELVFGNISTFERIRLDGTATTARIHSAPRQITGRITSRGEAVRATVTCGGAEQASDLSGYYRCWRPAGAAPLMLITPCDGTTPYQATFDEDVTVVDVDIPSNSLKVTVLDAATRQPIEGAFVGMWEGSPAQVPEPDTTPLGTTSETGEIAAQRLAPRSVFVCATKEGFERACVEDELAKDADESITLALAAATVTRGRIADAGEIRQGRLHVVLGAAGLMEVDVDPDGTFSLRAPLPPTANYVLTSASHPLCVLQVDRGQDLVLRLPALRPLSFSVASATTRSPVTLEMGSVLLASSIFARHQFLRRESYAVVPGRPMRVADVDGARGVQLVVGGVALAGAPPSDPAALPRMAIRPDQTVTLP